MKFYTASQPVPLAFHKFFFYFTLPLYFIYSFSAVLSIPLPGAASFTPLYLIDFSFTLSICFLSAATFVGLLNWRSYARYYLLALYIVSTLYRLIPPVVSLSSGASIISLSLGSALGIALFGSLVCLYYHKRKALFMSRAAASATSYVPPDTNLYPPSTYIL